jgi:kynurenine formamidase
LTPGERVSTIDRAAHPLASPSAKNIEEEKPMKFESVLRAPPVIAVAASLLAGAPAFADDDRHHESLLHLIKKARLVDLSHTWEITSPVAGVNPPYSFALKDTHANSRPNFDGHLSFTSEVMQFSGQHGAPSIDALGHIGHDGKLFGGVDANAATSNPDGIGASGVGAHLAIDRFPKELLITRGVLLDVARLLQKDGSPLPANCSNLPNTCEITADHLQRAAKRQGVRIRPGDTVFIRTGWGQFFTDPATYNSGLSPGPSAGGAEWLIKQGARIVGSDTLTFEKLPPLAGTPGQPDFRIFPVHQLLIPGAGVFIIENLNLEELAKLRAYEFVVVIPPLKIKGGTGSAIRAFALVEKRRDRRDD